MKALCIRQPWAWLIVHGYKRVENRTWRTHYRGSLLIHAAQKFDREGYLWVLANTEIGLDLPSMFAFQHEEGMRGGIVGQAELYDVSDHTIPARAPIEAWTGRHGEIADPTPWFFGPHGFWLRDATPLPFRAMPGKLGLFDVEQAHV